jgi:methionine synthase II (cobalamin-independent)
VGTAPLDWLLSPAAIDTGLDRKMLAGLLLELARNVDPTATSGCSTVFTVESMSIPTVKETHRLLERAANARHEHEWKIWREVKLPAGKVIVPGVIDSTVNTVEHPEVAADRILNFANVVGRENVIAGVDCGFGTFAGRVQVDSKIVWLKLQSLAEGARRASAQLWAKPES